MPKHLIGLLDTSCLSLGLVKAPIVKNADVLRYSRKRAPHSTSSEEKSGRRGFLVATYECHAGYKFKKKDIENLYCSNRRWIGEMPICIEASNLIQNDDSNVPVEELATNEKLILDECPENFQNNCEHGCKMINNEPTCTCLLGYALRNGSCEDIDECQKENGNCEKDCQNTLGSFRCICPSGFELAENGFNCIDVNECLSRNGHGPCQDICENTLGSYKCSCENLEGTKLSNDFHNCVSIDECMSSNCSHGCVNTRGKAFCTCPDGMVLGSDWKTCHGKAY